MEEEVVETSRKEEKAARFFCYGCSQQIPGVAPSMTCLACDSGWNTRKYFEWASLWHFLTFRLHRAASGRDWEAQWRSSRGSPVLGDQPSEGEGSQTEKRRESSPRMVTATRIRIVWSCCWRRVRRKNKVAVHERGSGHCDWLRPETMFIHLYFVCQTSAFFVNLR